MCWSTLCLFAISREGGPIVEDEKEEEEQGSMFSFVAGYGDYITIIYICLVLSFLNNLLLYSLSNDVCCHVKLLLLTIIFENRP